MNIRAKSVEILKLHYFFLFFPCYPPNYSSVKYRTRFFIFWIHRLNNRSSAETTSNSSSREKITSWESTRTCSVTRASLFNRKVYGKKRKISRKRWGSSPAYIIFVRVYKMLVVVASFSAVAVNDSEKNVWLFVEKIWCDVCVMGYNK